MTPRTTDPASEPTAGLRTALRLIRSRNLGPYLAGNALSACGTWFHNLAAALLLYRLTGAAALLGVLSAAQFLPMLLFFPWAGKLCDRFDRRLILIWSQCAAAGVSALMAALALAGAAPPAAVLAITFVLGGLAAVATPAQQALATALVAPQDAGAAITLTSMTFNLARAAGPVAAAAVIAVLGIPVAFALNTLSYLVFVGALLAVRPREQRRASRPRLRESFALLRSNSELRWLLLIVAVVGFASDPVNTAAPAFARHFGQPDTAAGLIVGVFGAGAVAGAFVLAGRSATRRMLIGMLLLLGGSIAMFAAAPTLATAVPCLALAGAGYLGGNVLATARLLARVDETHAGRIMALWLLAWAGVRPVGSLADGLIADHLGVDAAGAALALPALIVAVVAARRAPVETFSAAERRP